MRQTPRLVFAAFVLICLALTAYAIFYLQGTLGLEPCPMCILQRFAFFGIAAVSLVGAVWNPRGAALRTLCVLVALFALAGAGVAIRHSYLQHFPPQTETCGTDLEFLLNTFSLAEAFPKIFAGTGSCSRIDWRFLGLTIPEWGLVWYLIFGACALWLAFAWRGRASRA